MARFEQGVPGRAAKWPGGANSRIRGMPVAMSNQKERLFSKEDCGDSESSKEARLDERMGELDPEKRQRDSQKWQGDDTG